MHQEHRDIIGKKETPKSFEDFQQLKYNDDETWRELKRLKNKRLTELKYSHKLDGKLNNRDARIWYNAQDKRIGDRIDTTLPLEAQARQAHELRNRYKQETRNMMARRDLAQKLEQNKPLLDFSFYFRKYEAIYATTDDVYRAIVDSSMRPNTQVNRDVGIE